MSFDLIKINLDLIWIHSFNFFSLLLLFILVAKQYYMKVGVKNSYLGQ